MSASADLVQRVKETTRSVEERQKAVEKVIDEQLAQSQECSERFREAITRLDNLIAEQKRYRAMNPVQQLFYRLLHRPAWL